MPHMQKITTIQLSDATRQRIARHKSHPRQPYEDVINRALDLLEEDDLEITPAFAAKIAEGRRDVKAGRVYTTAELIKELGL
jgi:predicted transcriptional regulator